MTKAEDAASSFVAQFRPLEWYRSNVPCAEACPVHTDAGRYVQLAGQGAYEEAFLVARSPNPMASTCGRVCAAPCEDACRRQFIDAPVTIRPIKRYLTEAYGAESANPDLFRSLLDTRVEHGFRRDWHLSQLRAQRTEGGRKIAVIGAGPAGLACAHDLAVYGYDVTIFEALEHAGGMLRYGIPEYRLPRGVLDREVDAILKLGVTLRTGVALTSEYNLRSLRDEGYEAIFLGVGAMRGRDIQLDGSDQDGVIKAVDYLLNLNRGFRTELGDEVVVIGGGLVALDAARTAVREFYKPMEEIELAAESAISKPAFDAARGALRAGAKKVHVVALESMAELPAGRSVQGREELDEALREGVELHTSRGPHRICGDGTVTGIELVRVSRVFDDQGRFSPQFDEADKIHLPASSVILAIGQQPDLSFISDEDGIELTRGGTIKINPETLATTAPGIYAGGDAAFGPRIAIEAVANGKKAAQSIHSQLAGSQRTRSLRVQIDKLPIADYAMLPGFEREPRVTPPTVDTERRTGIAEVENVFDEADVRTQGQRCLACHVDTIYDPERCVLCGRCADVCPSRCLVFVPMERVAMPAEQRTQAFEHYGYSDQEPLTALLKDDTACIRCGLCAERCPTEAMTMEKFGFEETSP